MLSEINNHQLSNIIKQTKSFSKIEFDTSKLPIRQREKIRNRFIEFYKWENGKLSPICIVANPNFIYDTFFSDIKVSYQCICETEGRVRLSCDFERSVSEKYD
jgi:hypothetical protein